METKVVLEIIVDKQNEKWPWAFEHILITIHKIIEETKSWVLNKITYTRPTLSFEVAKIWNKIRFFVIVSKIYSNFIKSQIYAHYSNIEIIEVWDYLENIPDDKIIIWEVQMEKHFIYPIKTFTQIQENSTNSTIDPYSSLTSSLSKTQNNTLNVFQVVFSPIPDALRKNKIKKIIEILESKKPKFLKKFLISDKKWFLKFCLNFMFKIARIIKHLIIRKEKVETELSEAIQAKSKLYWYWVNINLISAWEDAVQTKMNLKEIISTLWVFSFPWNNWFKIKEISSSIEKIEKIKSRICSDSMILSTQELSGLVHLPTSYVKTPAINRVLSRSFEPPANLPIVEDLDDLESDLTPIWVTNFRWFNQKFGIGPSDRRRHMYVIWKTWMWKSTLLENMIIDDIRKWRWVAVIDPHWDLAENIIWSIPKSRTNQTIIFDPSDVNYPIAFNMFDWVKEEHRTLVASGIVSIFKKIFGDSWWPRLEHILRNTILALLENKNTTLISIPLMLTSEVFRNKIISKVTDPMVKKFWLSEFAKMAPNQRQEAIWPILNKVWQFLSSSIIRNVLGQPKNTFDIRWAMDNQKIVIINLSKWKIWEDASSLLWAMMVTKFQLDAMSRADIAEKDRTDFYLYVDEFQNFATDSFSTILSEARKYKLNLVMANQYIDQMTQNVKWAVFWNVWSTVAFQVWYWDSTVLSDVLWGDATSQDLTNVKKYSIYMKQLIDWMPSPVFSADTFAPYKIDRETFEYRYKKILTVSREKYASTKAVVEAKIRESIEKNDEDERKLEDYKEKLKEKIKLEKKQAAEANWINTTWQVVSQPQVIVDIKPQAEQTFQKPKQPYNPNFKPKPKFNPNNKPKPKKD